MRRPCAYANTVVGRTHSLPNPGEAWSFKTKRSRLSILIGVRLFVGRGESPTLIFLEQGTDKLHFIAKFDFVNFFREIRQVV